MNALSPFPEYQRNSSTHRKHGKPERQAEGVQGVQGVQQIMRCMANAFHNDSPTGGFSA